MEWNCALNATFSNPSDRDDVLAPDFGLGQNDLNQMIRQDYQEWNENSISELGVRPLTGILCAVHEVLGIEYCPPLPDLGKLY